MEDGKLAEVVYFRTCVECGLPIKHRQRFVELRSFEFSDAPGLVHTKRKFVHYAKCFQPAKHMNL